MLFGSTTRSLHSLTPTILYSGSRPIRQSIFGNIKAGRRRQNCFLGAYAERDIDSEGVQEADRLAP